MLFRVSQAQPLLSHILSLALGNQLPSSTILFPLLSHVDSV